MKGRCSTGFALVITLVLMALLVLAVVALSALTKVGSEAAVTTTYQTQARQNALLGLTVAIGQLQQFAAQDSAITGTADIVSNTNQLNNRWTGVWVASDIEHPHWLVSGNVVPATYTPNYTFNPLTGSDRVLTIGSINDIALVANGSTNTTSSTPTSNQKYLSGDAVVVPKVSIPRHSQSEPAAALGDYAYWVGDEGVKLSAGYQTADMPAPPAAQTLGVDGAGYPRKGADGLVLDSGKVGNALTYEQLVHAGTTSSSSSAAKLRSSFHGVTLANLAYTNTFPKGRTCLININSAGRRLWRGIWLTYNPGASDTGTGSSDMLNTFATQMVDPNNIWTPGGAAKVANGPFMSVDYFFLHAGVVAAITGIPNSDFNAFKAALKPWLTVRSDTFRIRAYGDALNPVVETAGKVEATAYCEAIVQRIKDSTTAAGEGRFVITYFRWLGPDDI